MLTCKEVHNILLNVKHRLQNSMQTRLPFFVLNSVSVSIKLNET